MSCLVRIVTIQLLNVDSWALSNVVYLFYLFIYFLMEMEIISIKEERNIRFKQLTYIKWVNQNAIYDKLWVNFENLPIMALQHTVGMHNAIKPDAI